MVSATSVALVGIVLLAAAFFDPKAGGEGLVIALRTITMWGVFGVAIFGYARLFGGVGTLSQTWAAIFKVMPVAYVAGAVGAVLIGTFMQSYTDDWRFIESAAAFDVAQFVVVGLFLPRCVSALHRLGKYGAAAMYVIPLVVLADNIQFAAIPQYKELKAEQQTKMQKPVIEESKLRVYWPVLSPFDPDLCILKTLST